MEIKLKGRLKLDSSGLRVHLDHDFVNYYKKLIDMYFYKTRPLFTPRHGAHISVVIKSIHPRNFDQRLLQKYHNRDVEFTYDPHIILGGRDFTNYWVKVNFPLGEQIKREAGIYERNFHGFHITICSDKCAINEGKK